MRVEMVRGRMLSAVVSVVTLWLAAVSGVHAASIDAPASSATGTFRVSWSSGYELRLADVNWRVATPPVTSADFKDLPAGTYKFVLVACGWSYTAELGSLYLCNTLPASAKTVVVTGAEPRPIEDWTSEAGNTPYRAGVGMRGSAQITVPLRAPAGANGVALDLALAYDSARNGDRPRYVVDDVLGYGWSLQGVPYIHRCRAGQPLDANRKGMPSLTASDVICLDGEPLALVAGTHWAADAEYRAASNPDLKVTLRETTGVGRWFEVRYPDGAVGRFGDSVDSRVLASGQAGYSPYDAAPSETYFWGLRSLTGALGDQLTVAYQRFDGYGNLQPLSIAYAGAEVRFRYGPRTDLQPVAVAGAALVRRLSVLTGVEVRMNGLLLREYRLGNRYDAAGRLRLERVQECGFDEQGSAVACLMPLRLQWSSVSGGAMGYPIAVSELIDGLGARTGYSYGAITAASNVLSYPEAPFGTLMAVADTSSVDVAAVSELRVSDGLTPGGFRRWSYRYKGFPLVSTRSRGYVGFPEWRATDQQSGVVAYTQARLDWPFLGAASQVRSFDAPFGAHTQELAREEHGYVQKVHANGSRHAYLARSTRWQFDGGVMVGASVSSTSFCYRTLSAETCPATGAENEFPTQRRTVTIDGVALASTVFTPAFWGDVPVRTIATQNERHSVTEVAALVNTTLPWMRGAVSRQTVTHAMPGQTSRTVGEDFVYLPGTRVARSITRFRGDARLEVVSTRLFDGAAANAVSGYTVQGVSMPARTWNFTTPYEDGRHVARTTNPLGQTSSRVMDDRFGAARSMTDPDGRTATIEYDPFGRRVREVAADGTEVTVVHARCDQSDCGAVIGAEPAMRITVSTRNGATQTAPTQVTYLDVLGRAVLEEVEALEPSQGAYGRRTGYDSRNRVQFRSRPVLGAVAPVCTAVGPDCTWYTYDIRDRLVREDRPDGGVTTTAYSGGIGRSTVTTTETVKVQGQTSGARTMSSTYDVLGLVTQTTDAVGSAGAVTTSYTYDAEGNLTGVAVGGTMLTTLEYDLAGNRTKMVDASSGATDFSFNALGELVRSTDAKGQPTTYEYDLLGRLIRRTDSGGVAHAWTWDPVNGSGRLRSRSRPGFAESYSYGADRGRLTRVDSQVNVPDVWTGSQTRVLDYDAAGRLVSQQFPNGQSATYGYSGSGYLTRVTSGGVVLQELRATDAFGNVTDERYHGDAFRTLRTYDPALGMLLRTETGTPTSPRSIQDLETVWRSSGSLYRRLDRRNTATTADDYVDTFGYDAMERLVRQATTTGASRVLDFGYGANGNLMGKSSSVTGDLNVSNYVYGGSVQPNRLSSVTINGIANSLSHDANGNVVQYAAAVGPQTWLRYDARNNVARITAGTDETAFQARDEFWYDPDDRRFLSRETWDVAGAARARRILYLGGDYEEIRPPEGSAYDVVQRIQLTPAVRLVRRRTAGSQVWDVLHEYLHRDHLGSVDAITDVRGTVLSRTAFDPFGTRRSLNRAGDLTSVERDALLAEQDIHGARGFTDHEHLDRTGFIHMNGRVYDPRIGRFTSPDPLVQVPRFSQAHNRYAYVFNDPLSRTDPSGFCGREEGFQLNFCNGAEEYIRITAQRDGGGYFGGLNPDGGNFQTLGPVNFGGVGGLSTLLGMEGLFTELPDYPEPPDAEQAPVEVITVSARRESAEAPDGMAWGWVSRGLSSLDGTGVQSLFGSGCVGAVLGGCGVFEIDAASGKVSGMLMVGIIPGAGVAFGAEGVMFLGDFQKAAGFGTAVMVTGGMRNIGGSIGIVQGTNGVNVTSALGYGFGLGGGVGFYYAGPIGSISR